MPKEANRVYVGVLTPSASRTIQTYSFWNEADPNTPSAWDIASNGTWLYCGFLDAIYKSEDSGDTWFQLVGAGAYDIRVDPAASGAIWTFSPTGSMILYVAGVAQSSILTEAPRKKPLRIAKGASTGNLYAISDAALAGDSFKRRYLGAWSTLVSGIIGASGVRCFNPYRVVYLKPSAATMSMPQDASPRTTTRDKALTRTLLHMQLPPLSFVAKT